MFAGESPASVALQAGAAAGRLEAAPCRSRGPPWHAFARQASDVPRWPRIFLQQHMRPERRQVNLPYNLHVRDKEHCGHCVTCSAPACRHARPGEHSSALYVFRRTHHRDRVYLSFALSQISRPTWMATCTWLASGAVDAECVACSLNVGKVRIPDPCH